MTAHTDVVARRVASADGTSIGCLKVGRGPGLVILHGAMQTAGSQLELAQALADTWRVTLPDRRGRGASGPRQPHREQHTGIETDVADINAVVTATGAEAVVGVSSGAILALLAAREFPPGRRVVAFEPPILPDAQQAQQILSRVEEELAEGRVDAALTTGWLATQLGPAFLRRLPRPAYLAAGLRRPPRGAAAPATGDPARRGHEVTGNRAQRGRPDVAAAAIHEFLTS